MKKMRKLLMAAAGGVAMVATSGNLSGSAQVWASAVLAVLTALGVYVVPNEAPADEPVD